jgi:hypothetical protein
VSMRLVLPAPTVEQWKPLRRYGLFGDGEQFSVHSMSQVVLYIFRNIPPTFLAHLIIPKVRTSS